jgi:hypothetical protein
MRDPIHDYRDILQRSFHEARARVFGDPSVLAERAKLAQYEERPVAFVRDCLGERTWPGSRVQLRALWKHHRILVCGCRKSTKSHTGAQAALAMTIPAHTRTVVTAPTHKQVRENIFAHIRKLHAAAPMRLPGELGVTSLRMADPTWYAIGVATNRPDNMQGFHAGITLPPELEYDDELIDEDSLLPPNPQLADEDAKRAERHPGDVIGEEIFNHRKRHDRSRLFFLIDETAGMEPDILETILGSLMGDRSYAMMPFNPTFSPDSGHPAARFLKAGSRFHRIHIAGREPPKDMHPPDMFDECVHGVPEAVMPQQWVNESIKEWGPDSGLTMAHVYGLPSTIDREHQFVPYRILNEASTRGVTAKYPREFRHLGWDVSGSDDGDDNVAQLWVNGLLTDQHVWKEPNTARSREMVEGMAREWKVPDAHIHVDATGGSMGKSVVDEWRNRGRWVDGVDFGSAPRGEWNRMLGPRMVFVNRKAELLWVLRALLQNGMASIPRTFTDTFVQAQWYTYKEVTRDKSTALQCAEDKKKIKQIYGRSPDHLEAAILAMSRGISGPVQVHSADSLDDLAALAGW